MACWSVSMVYLPITLLGNPHILWQRRTFRESPFFLVAFHGNFKSGTAQSGSLADVVQTTQVAIPTSGRQKITYVLSNRDKLFVLIILTRWTIVRLYFLHCPMMQVLLRGSVRTSSVTSSSLDREQPRSQQPKMSTMREIWNACGFS